MEKQQLTFLKKKYNEKLERNKNAEEYFKTHTVKECIKYLSLFNTVTRELSNLIVEIESLTGRKMTGHEKLNGF
ncbi:hypothetical protein SR42_15305 [Clostridium botulinum]|uniref:hypothetical protein n=1 Tax=Clostridium botulinum TaxID=1491 RepID=UPI000597A2F9|nr:hypothetical protein [Clostridium botulinum]KIL06929.1 hypothetical protein SR42_15305 [Clostridium botulinum]MBY6935266.1 hypothetical protein [Clostridium botulinum]MBY6948402.1 hypothetical protein [Clostridium botulinum]MBY7021385.1 hypothetical protein [Clostridium botulinum]NFI30651.1 hypothetical protein [Clostridium botulinum]